MLRRVGFKRKNFKGQTPDPLADHHEKARLRRGGIKPLANRKPLNKIGPRTKDWRAVWRWLKPRLEAAGRTSCEFRFLPHVCGGPLDPAHSKKRREMQGTDIYDVAIACRTIHTKLDYGMSHAEMYEAVMTAINANGGPVRRVA